MHGEWQLPFEPVEMTVDRLRLSFGIREEGAVRHRPDLAVRCHEGERRRLDAGAERQNTKTDRHVGAPAPLMARPIPLLMGVPGCAGRAVVLRIEPRCGEFP